jgi:hypothetical protein
MTTTNDERELYALRDTLRAIGVMVSEAKHDRTK